MSAVLDACALIAYLNGEEGANQVESLFRSGKPVLISGVNLLEVAYDAVRTGQNPHAAQELLEEVSQIPLKVVWEISKPVFLEAARLKSSFKISLADAVGAALSRAEGYPLATSDHHEFESLASLGEVNILWIR